MSKCQEEMNNEQNKVDQQRINNNSVVKISNYSPLIKKNSCKDLFFSFYLLTSSIPSLSR